MHPRVFALILSTVAAALALASCGDDAGENAPGGSSPTLTIGAIPDQDPQELQRLYGTVASHLAKALDVKVEYKPVTDYTAAVTAFRVGDLDLVWFGGLTGVQAQKQVRGPCRWPSATSTPRFTACSSPAATAASAPSRTRPG